MALSETSSLDITYSGQFAGTATAHSLKATFSMEF